MLTEILQTIQPFQKIGLLIANILASTSAAARNVLTATLFVLDKINAVAYDIDNECSLTKVRRGLQDVCVLITLFAIIGSQG
jgi:hypothetical protein